ncbi:MAG: nicotinamide riboside transporter PnuC [Bacteroidota bacterium]
MMLQISDWLLLNWIELTGAVTGIIGVWLTTKQIIWCWPVALINVIFYIYIFFVSKLYADFGLQIFYLVMTLYGWYNWLWGGENRTELKVTHIKRSLLIFCLITGTIGFLISGFLLNEYTDAAFPFIDSLIAVWGIIGTFLMAKKIIEHWLIWIIVDIIATIIYLAKELDLTAGLYFIFTLLAASGYFKWKKDLKTITC